MASVAGFLRSRLPSLWPSASATFVLKPIRLETRLAYLEHRSEGRSGDHEPTRAQSIMTGRHNEGMPNFLFQFLISLGVSREYLQQEPKKRHRNGTQQPPPKASYSHD